MRLIAYVLMSQIKEETMNDKTAVRDAYIELLKTWTPEQLMDELQRTAAAASHKASYDREDEDDMIKLVRAELLSRM